MNAQQEIQELKDLLREAHAAIKDLKIEVREAGTAALELRELVRREAHERVDTILAERTKAGLDALAEVVETVTAEATARIKERFALVDEQLELMMRMGQSAMDEATGATPPKIDGHLMPDILRMTGFGQDNPEVSLPNREARRQHRKQKR